MPEQTASSAWLKLLTTPGLGPARGGKLISHFGSARAAIDGALRESERFKISPEQAHHLNNDESPELTRAQAWLAQAGHHLIPIDDERYPPALKDLNDPPLGLFALGDLDLLQGLHFAIVGSRNPSPAGARHARLFAQDLASRGLTIVSGLASGIDAAAHQGALDADGMTVAITGTGLDIVYPASNRELARKIAQNGLLISEFPPGTRAKRDHFPRRNRLIAALSKGSLVVEAAIRSGSLITARLASELGREVMAMPGAIDNPLAKGCHRLIRQGAKLVECSQDILEELVPIIDNGMLSPAPMTQTQAPTSESDLAAEYHELLQLLDSTPRAVDELQTLTGRPVNELSSMLLILELQGLIASTSNGAYQKLKPLNV